MADAEVQNGNGDSSSTKTVVIIIVIVALAALGFYLLSNRSTPEDQPSTGTEREEVVTEKEKEEIKETAADLQKLRLFKNFAQQVEPILSDAGKESLEVVVVFVETNPDSLEDGTGIPGDVVAAAKSVWTEVETLWGDSVVVLQESVAVVGDDGEEMPAVEVGDVVTLDGPIELADIESPLGPVFSVVSNENGQTYYLVFDEAETERVMTGLLGQEVIMDVEVTAMNEDGTAGFKVVSGPDLAE